MTLAMSWLLYHLKRRKLGLEDLEHIYKVVEILKRTIELVRELEKIEPKF
ncbi:hypothetical protein [Thermococcus stetteri]|nr:hypothetical protein [Thermococcus stetteri]MBP1911204.1 hypothetical protein [Thermococcus stetteri]